MIIGGIGKTSQWKLKVCFQLILTLIFLIPINYQGIQPFLMKVDMQPQKILEVIGMVIPSFHLNKN